MRWVWFIVRWLFPVVDLVDRPGRRARIPLELASASRRRTVLDDDD